MGFTKYPTFHDVVISVIVNMLRKQNHQQQQQQEGEKGEDRAGEGEGDK